VAIGAQRRNITLYQCQTPIAYVLRALGCKVCFTFYRPTSQPIGCSDGILSIGSGCNHCPAPGGPGDADGSPANVAPDCGKGGLISIQYIENKRQLPIIWRSALADGSWVHRIAAKPSGARAYASISGPVRNPDNLGAGSSLAGWMPGPPRFSVDQPTALGLGVARQGRVVAPGAAPRAGGPPAVTLWPAGRRGCGTHIGHTGNTGHDCPVTSGLDVA
jgi:hypothetical protein